jgi:predicted RNA binding protein YcfA (HicA-like mRNA interferase family)
VKLPRDLSGAMLIISLKRLGYRQTRQTGSHVRMTVMVPREGHLTIPLTKALPAGTLAALLKDAARQLDTTVENLLSRIV